MPPKAEILPFGFANRHGALVDSWQGDTALLLVREDTSEQAWREARRMLQSPIILKICSTEDFTQALERHYGKTDENPNPSAMEVDIDIGMDFGDMPEPKDLLDADDDAPIIRLINLLLLRGINLGASDVHIEPFEDIMRVRFRIDGVLQTAYETRQAAAKMVASRIKVMSGMDIAEKRLPQDGRLTLRIGGRVVDVRVSTLPGAHGERVVMRLLDKRRSSFSLDQIGFREEQLAQIEGILGRPNGIVLVTGPTGSGKTTTLYAMVEQLNGRDRNIITVEDPIEYDLPNIGQTQVNSHIGMTFARSLRAILRQDPDVILVGEIRDEETAQIAVQASLTGHLVLSTLHTNSALGALTRMRDMKVESFLLSSTIVGLIAQRLVRRICDECRESVSLIKSSAHLFTDVGLKPPEQLSSGRGCSACGQTGYHGQIGVYEVVPIDDEVRALIHKDVGEKEIERYALRNTDSLRMAVLRRVQDQTTTLAEAMRVTRE